MSSSIDLARPAFGVLASCALLCSGEVFAQSWSHRALTTRPPVRGDHASALDPVTGEVLIFGGNNFGGALADTWTFNGSRWLLRTPATSPSARARTAMATDTTRGVTVLFDGDTLLNDTWEWNGTTWTQVFPITSPPVRDKHAMAFDPILGVVVLFGGDGGFSSLADTWTFNGVTWTPVVTATTPAARENAGLEFDPGVGQVVLFGGHGRVGAGSYWLNDTWGFTGTNWVSLATANAPTPREDHAMAFDAVRSTLVVTNGWVNPTGVVADQWERSLVDWTNTTPALMPGLLRAHSMDYGPRGELIMFGGVKGSSRIDETWTVASVMPFGGNVPVWHDPAAPASCPSALADPRLTSDTPPVINTTMLFDLTGFDPAVGVAGISIGFTQAPAPCPGISHVSTTTAAVAMTGGVGAFPLAIPNNPALAGLVAFAQAFGIDSASTLIASNQVIAVVGF